MKLFSDTFRENLREDRQLNAIVSYRTSKAFNILTTQDDKNLMTENSDFLVTEKGYLNYDKESINSVNPLFNTSLFKTTCKSVQIDSINKIDKGTWLNIKIGTYKEETNDYEYLDFGNYYVNEEPTYQADTDSYLTIAYDKMIESMISYDDNQLNITFPINHKDFLIAICEKFNWNYDLIDYPNYNKNIIQDFYKGQNLTYRDILDDLNGVCGGSFMFDLENKLIWKRPTETNEIVEDDDLKDTNVDFSEKFGKVNALTITTNGNVVLDSKEDTQSIQKNGKTEFNINDNYILNYSTDDFIDEIFNEINGLEYYLYDVDSTGLLIFEPLDIFTFRHNGVDYKTIMFNDDIKLTQGLVETTYAEKPDEVEKDYKTTDKDKNKLNNAIISLDKANAEIVLKVDSNGKISQVRLDGDADDGSIIDINADQVNLTANDILNLIAGNTINLTAKNIKIDSENFKVDEIGNATLNNSVINMTENNKKVAEFNKSGMDFYRNDILISHMGTTTKTDNIIGVGTLTYNESSTDVKYNSVISWNAQRSSGSTTYDGVIAYYNLPSLKGLVIRSDDVLFNGSTIEINNIFKGNLIFEDITNAGVITTSLSQNDNLWISRIVGDGTGNLIASSFLGNITISGKASDKRLKKNIKLSKDNALNKINKIKIYEFDFKQNNKHVKNGVIAQELEQIDESLIIKNNDKKGLYQVDDLNLLTLAIKSIQELNKKVEDLEKQINNMKKEDDK